MNLSFQIIMLFLCIGGAAFFAGSETGFVSWNPLKIEHRALGGDIVARWALFLIRHKDRMLSALLIGNNICIIGASLSFSMIYEEIDHVVGMLGRLPSPESWFLTPVIVLFGEMLPKSLFRIYPFILTIRSVPLLMTVYFLTLPFTFVFSIITGLFRKESVNRGDSFMAKVREEMVLIAMEGAKSGTLFKSADIFIQNLLSLNEKKVKDIVANNNNADFIRFYTTENVGEAKKRIPEHGEIIVFKENSDIYGYIPVLDLINAPDDAKLEKYCKKLPMVKADDSLSAALQLIDNKNNYFLINDRAGNTIAVIDKMSLLKGTFTN